MIQLLPGASPLEGRNALDAAKIEAGNIRGADAVDRRLTKYRQWVVRTARVLGSYFTSATVDELVVTRTYWAVLAVAPAADALGPLGELLDLELDERAAALESAKVVLEDSISRWGQWHGPELRPSRYGAIVLDTNVLLRHVNELTEIDWPLRAGLGQMESLALGIPMVVVQELDRLKDSNGAMWIGGERCEVRTLARKALKELDSIFPGTWNTVLLRPSSAESLRGKLYAVLMVDEPMHAAIPEADLEIIDQAERIKPYAASVKLATYDQSMIFRARAVGLDGFRPTDDV